MSMLKRIFVGRPIASEDIGHTLLPKTVALPVFASDPLSSNAYATEEILHALAYAGAASFWLVTPLAGVIAAVVVVVIISYRQTIAAYPGGGGSYIVARENLGTNYGLTAASALLADYVLTVAVSVSAGVAAIGSALPEIAPYRVSLAVTFVVLLMLANLRGVKEAGTFFAVPTYAFVACIWTLLVVGAVRCAGGCPQAESAALQVEALEPLGLFIILRAFASGATALTGIEAISDGVPAFQGRRPAEQARNAITTITVMGFLTLSMFIGISLLARGTRVFPIDEKIAEEFGLHEMTVVAQIAETVAGHGWLFFAIQATTAAILILAANTAYADFPRLSSILAKDRFLPRQFMNRGDRLVFSNGVVALSAVAIVLIVVFDARVTRLIQLYVVGVFTTFTISQAGMVRRWLRLKSPGWRLKVALNGFGATTTGLVLVIVAYTKFIHGAWIVILAIPLIVLAFWTINRHYQSVSAQLRRPEGRPVGVQGTRALVIVENLDPAALRAIGYAMAMRPLEVRALHVDSGNAEEIQRSWEMRQMSVPLTVVPAGGDLVDQVREQVALIRRDPEEFVTLVIPEAYSRTGKRALIGRRRTLLLKAAMLFERRVVVTDVPTVGDPGTSGERGAIAPARVAAVVLVSAVHNATLRALEYARSLSPTDLRAVTFNVDPEESDQVLSDWIENVDTIPLEAVDSPYREITKPLIAYARRLREGQPDLVVSIIVPEFVASSWWHHFLHNQTALAIKYALQFEPGVILTSVPFHLE